MRMKKARTPRKPNTNLMYEMRMTALDLRGRARKLSDQTREALKGRTSRLDECEMLRAAGDKIDAAFYVLDAAASYFEAAGGRTR
jgi:hypothetical protein